MMMRSRRTIAGIAVVAAGAAAAIGVAVSRGHADTGSIPPDAVSKLASQQVSVVQQAANTAVVSADSVEKTLSGEGQMTVNGAYVVAMVDAKSKKTCTCWLILYTPNTPYQSEGGLTANFYSAFFDANTGAYVEGINGKLP
jgi:hypothetical protein